MTPNLPEDLFFDLVNEDEVEGAAEVEKRGGYFVGRAGNSY